MITFFRLHSFLQVFSILVVLLLLKLPFGIGQLPTLMPELEWLLVGQKMADGQSLYREVWTSTSPILSFIYYSIHTVLGDDPLFFDLFTLFVVFIQALLFNYVCSARRLFLEKSYVPALVYIIVMSVSFDLQKMSPPLLGTTFILLALNSVLRQTESSQINTNHSFEIGFFIGLASLTHFPISVLIIWAITVLVVYSNLNLRQFLLLLLGFALPFLFFIIYFSFVNSIQEFQEQWLSSIFSIKAFSFSNFYNSLFVYALPFVFMGLGVIKIFSVSRYNSYQNRAHQITFILGVFCLLCVILSDNTATYQFAVMAPVIAFFATAFFLHLKGTYLPEVLFLIFISTVAIIHKAGESDFFGAKYEHLASIRVNEEVGSSYEGKRILVTGSDNSAYQNAESATKYLNWSLSRFELQNPNNYQSVVSINETFKADFPEVIIDNEKVFPEIFEILPEIGKAYKRQGDNKYVLRN